MKFAGIALLHLLSAAAFAATPCTDLSIPLEKIGPSRNQGISGLCFAYEAADLVSFRLGTRVSAVDLAMAYLRVSKYQKMSSIFAHGGDSVKTIEEAVNSGFCAESDLPSDEDAMDLSPKPHSRMSDAFAWLETHDWNDSRALETARLIFPNVTSADLEAANGIPHQKSRLTAILNANCRERIPFPELRIEHRSGRGEKGRRALLPYIDQALESGVPVGIGFKSNPIYIIQDKEDEHAVTLVGRRYNAAKGSCEYLLRDNFGPQCEIYKPEFECDRGTLWVSDELLAQTLFEAEVIRN